MFDANKLLNQMLGAGPGAPYRAPGGSPMDQIGGLMGSLLSDSVVGMKEGAAELERKTGIGASTDKAVRGATGRSSAELFDKVKAFAGENRMATMAALGGVGALLLGTRGGRGILGGGAALGGLAMIGGLAYKAFQNLNAQKAAARTPAAGAQGLIEAAPAESPFGETGNALEDNDVALLILRAMIAAAACDGLIDSRERARIIDGLEDVGLEHEAAKVLDAEMAKPATIPELVAAVKNEAVAAEVYAAARIAIEPNCKQEAVFLDQLAKALKLDPGLVAQIDANASGARFH
jgi:uncharacterized membrane protein YebE (DUF533 family)